MNEVIAIGEDGFYHPANETDIRNLILFAKSEGQKIRVRGSAHSVKAAIYAKGDEGINLMLDKMAEVKIDKQNMKVTVQAGCHLGRDPYDPS